MLLANSPARSGSENDHISSFTIYDGLYLAYIAAISTTTFKIRSKSFIIGLSKKLHIQCASFDRYLCPICWQGKHANDGTYPIKKRERFLSRYEKHHSFVEYQRSLHKNQRSNLGIGEVMLIYDYSRFHETSEVKIHDLGTVMVLNKRLFYFDFFAEAPHDYHYTFTVITMLFANNQSLQEASKVKIWSDGALRTKENLFLFSQLQRIWNVELEVFIFPPYHGHSLADNHFGVGKKKLRKRFANGGLASMIDVEGAFAGMHNTTTYIIEEISTETYNIQPLTKGIQCFFAFTFPAEGVVRCWERFTESEYVDQFIKQKTPRRN